MPLLTVGPVEGVQQRGQAADGPAVPPRAGGDEDVARAYDRTPMTDQGVGLRPILTDRNGREAADGGVGIGTHREIGAVHMVVRVAVDPGADDRAVRRLRCGGPRRTG